MLSGRLQHHYLSLRSVFLVPKGSDDFGTLRAFVDGIFGDFLFVGKSPNPFRPEFKED